METKYKIEKNVPLRTYINRENAYPFKDMEPGDSFSVPESSLRVKRVNMSLLACAKSWAKNNGKPWKFVTRNTGDGNIRIWRVS
jgi:hypothetical protein